jgi:HEAT repeat protein
LGTDKGQEAFQAIAAIDDPFAVEALAQALVGKQADPRDQVRILLIEALAKIGTVPATKALAVCAIEDPVEEVRLTCLDYLKQKDNVAAVDHFIGRLQSKDNVEINRAAVALKEMNNPTAIGPLIDVLVTTHTYTATAGNPGQISTTFTPSGPGGLSVGNRPRIHKAQVSNRPVLEALVSLTGANFQFDEAKWKAWYAAQRRQPGMDARRD